MDIARSTSERSPAAQADSEEEAGDNSSASKRPRKTFRGICRLCGVSKEINRTANHRAVAIARHAAPDTAPIFERHRISSVHDSFRICAGCSVVVQQTITLLCATSSSSKEFLTSVMKTKTLRPAAKKLHTPLTFQRQPLVALFKSINTGERTVHLPSPPRENAFAVGDSVNLPRRKQANVNEDGGVAEVVDFRSTQSKGKRVYLYSVKHVLDHRVEIDLPESLLEPYSYADPPMKRRSVDTEARAAAVAEEKESEKLKSEIDRLLERVRNLEAEALRSRLRNYELRAQFVEAQRAASELGKKNDELTVKMTAQFELMQKNITDLIAEMKSQVHSEVESATTRDNLKSKILILISASDSP